MCVGAVWEDARPLTIDLHTHTTFSDGTFTPAEMVRLALQRGLTAISISDHDSTEGVSEACLLYTSPSPRD